MLARTDLRIRTFIYDDLPALVGLTNICAEHAGEDWRYNLEDAERDWHSPDFFPERDALVVFDEQNQLIAYGFCEKDVIPNRGFAGGHVHPEYRRQGIGTRLIRAAEEHFLQLALQAAAPEQPVYMQRWVSERSPQTVDLLEKEGYFLARTFFTMRINFDAPIEKPELPQGFELRPFDADRDARALHKAQQEAWQDHWGWVQEVPFDVWATRLKYTTFDPTLYFVAYQNDEIAGFSLSAPYGPEQPDMGWVQTLGVRRQYRKQGLAMALLRHSFHVFQQRGYARCGLGVDAANPTGALGLYERAGMHVHQRGFVYRKVLRGSPEDIQS